MNNARSLAIRSFHNHAQIGRNNRLFNDRMDRCRLLSCDIAYLLMYQLGLAVSDTQSYYKLQLYLRAKRLFFLYLLPFGTKSFLPKIKCFSSLPPLMLRFSCIFTIKTEMHRKTIIFADFYINVAVKNRS